MMSARRVLIVDPDPGARDEVARCLAPRGFEVETCDTAAGAAEKLKETGFQCIIIDVDLPDTLGFEAVPLLKGICPKTSVIMTAAANTLALESKVRSQDILYYHVKSFGTAELVRVVDEVFQRSGTEKQTDSEGRPRRILVVDDDADFVEATKLVLESGGYRVDTARDREEGTGKIESEPPDLILLDAMMGRIDDGFVMCYKLKHDPKYGRIPIVMVTGIVEKTGLKFTRKTDAEYLEADEHLDKPVEPGELLACVARLLAN